MKKALKYTALLLLVGFIGLGLYLWSKNEERPSAAPSAQADALARKMMQAIDKKAWDSTYVVQWTFMDMHHFLWDKGRKSVQVKWKENEVLLHTDTQTGQAFVDGAKVTGTQANELLAQAWSFFCNDSFWLNAPAKAFDKGTTRSIVTLDDGRQALLVSYSSGGVTPGDAYAWILDENGRPTSYKMWVNIIPVGGLEVSWEDWTSLSTGAKIAQVHNSSMFGIKITNLKAAANWEEMGDTQNPFDNGTF